MTRKKPRTPQRRARTKGHLSTVPTPSDRPEDQPLIQALRHALREESPLPTLITVSQLVEAALSRADQRDPEFGETMLETMLASFTDYQLRETTAALHVIGALLPDDLLRARIAKVLAARRHPMPDWIGELADVRVDRVVRSHHVLEDGDDYMLDVVLGRHRFTLLVYVDHNMGQIVKDAFVGDRVLEEALAFSRDNAEVDTAFDDTDPADARRWIADAVEAGRQRYPDHTTDTWPGIRPLVEYVLRDMPVGGASYPLTATSTGEVDELINDFLRSSYGHDHEGLDLEVRMLVAFACLHGTRDPLQWTPVSVEILLDQWLPLQGAEHDQSAMPDVLRDFIRYAHHRRRVAPRWTAETLASVARWQNSYYAQILGDAWTGTEELGRAMRRASEMTSRSRLERAVGGAEALAALDEAPLPAEPFDWSEVPDDLRPKIDEIVGVLTDHAADMLDDEHLTAELRILRRVALAEPALLRGRASASTTAAVIVWLVAKANESTSVYGPRTMGQLLERFGGTANSERARRFEAAVGGSDGWETGEVFLGSPDFLVSSHRAQLIKERDWS